MNRPDDGGVLVVTTTRPHTLHLRGVLAYDSVEALRAALMSWMGPDSVELDLTELEIADAAGVLAAVEVIRALARAAEHVAIRGAPQMLGHNLYRSGLLGAGTRIELFDMCEDEPYG